MGTAPAPATALHVSTDLDAIESPLPTAFADDIVISGHAYRRLDGAYYAWLRHRMTLARQAVDAGRLAPASFDAFRERFNVVHAWALEHIGEEALRAAIAAFDSRRYAPPRVGDDEFAPARVSARAAS
jgi:hypothetical protein